jgi:TATA-box binding protein (TBP) (component of TFIID and TFIIIB)
LKDGMNLQESVRGLTIVNVVATAELKQPVSLVLLRAVASFYYDPSGHHCAYFKDVKSRGKVSIFGTGKMISVATRTIEDAKLDLEHAKNVLIELGLITDVKLRVQLRNTVITADLGHAFDLAGFAVRPNVIYEPEQFPAVIYHPEELDGACVLVFASGKVVFSGIKTADFVDVCEEVLRKLI